MYGEVMEMVVRNEAIIEQIRATDGLPLWRSISVKKAILRQAKVSGNTLILHDSKLLEST
jgi:hypothetical protein